MRQNWMWRQVWLRAVPWALFVGFLFYCAWTARQTRFEPVHWSVMTSEAVVPWVRHLIERELAIFGLSYLLGVLTPLAFSPFWASEFQVRRWVPWLCCTFASLAIISLSLAVAWQELPALGMLLLPFACCVAGIRLGSAALRGHRSLLWAAGRQGLLMLSILAAGTLLMQSLGSSKPLEFDSREMSIADKRALTQRIRITRALDGEPRRVQFADAEINALVRSFSRRGNIQHQASVHFEPSVLLSRSSWKVWGQRDRQYTNIRLQGSLGIRDGHLTLVPQQVTVGRLNLPRPALWLLAHATHAMLLDDPQVRSIIKSVDELRIESGVIHLVFQPGMVGRQLVPSVANLLWCRPDVAMETSPYVSHLLPLHDRLRSGEACFADLLESAFSLAVQRSVDHDPQLENRAAIFALAILWGHCDLEPFVGEVLDAEQLALAERTAGTIAVRGRSDLPRHFLVSAALLLLSDEATSDLIGTLKEKIDAQEGGSGFSFVDVAANIAGNRFADAATRDQSTARAVQIRLSRGFRPELLFPSFDGLPENISAAEFQTRYGGLGGSGYRELMHEIRRRFDALPDPFR